MNAAPTETAPTLIVGRPAIGLDIGDRRIGAAVSDRLLIAATPYGTLKRGKLETLMRQLQPILDIYRPQAAVIGLPLTLGGREERRCQAIRDFSAQLATRLTIPLIPWDERFSTLAAERVLTEAGAPRRRQRAHVDKLAAAYILQSFLDAHRSRFLPPDASSATR